VLPINRRPVCDPRRTGCTGFADRDLPRLRQGLAPTFGAVLPWTVAMCGPSGLFDFGVSLVFERFRAARLTVTIQAGLVAVTIGMIAASALIIARASDHGWSAVAVTAATIAPATCTRLSPLIALAGAAALSPAGFV
jgi:chromate transporter